jgi:pimeloyl-ACP methyl ester carboxylesterase
MRIRRGFVDTPEGQIHYRTAGEGRPLILLHQTPRSSTEFLDIIAPLAAHFRVVAMDTVGYGDSFVPEKPYKIEDYARSVASLMEGLGLKRASIVGHHTGAIIAIAFEILYPDRVDKLVLSGCPYFDDAKRELRKKSPIIPMAQAKSDGSHLIEIWNANSAFYPPGMPEIMNRAMVDALKAGERARAGVMAIAEYPMDRYLGEVRVPTLLIVGTHDQIAYPDNFKVGSAIMGSKTTEIEGGLVSLVEHMPEEFIRVVEGFLKE